jgi:hypothetical protein
LRGSTVGLLPVSGAAACVGLAVTLCGGGMAWTWAGQRLVDRLVGRRPQGTRAPGSQLRITEIDGNRVTAFGTNTSAGGTGAALPDRERSTAARGSNIDQ